MPLPDQLATGILGLSGGQFEINCYLKTELASSTACFRERQGGLSGCGGVTYPHRRLSREGQGPPVPRPSSSHHLVPLTRVGSTCGSAQARPYPDGCGPDFRSALALEDPGPACRTHPRRGPWATAPALGVDWPGAVSGEGAVPPAGPLCPLCSKLECPGSGGGGCCTAWGPCSRHPPLSQPGQASNWGSLGAGFLGARLPSPGLWKFLCLLSAWVTPPTGLLKLLGFLSRYPPPAVHPHLRPTPTWGASLGHAPLALNLLAQARPPREAPEPTAAASSPPVHRPCGRPRRPSPASWSPLPLPLFRLHLKCKKRRKKVPPLRLGAGWGWL